MWGLLERAHQLGQLGVHVDLTDLDRMAPWAMDVLDAWTARAVEAHNKQVEEAGK